MICNTKLFLQRKKDEKEQFCTQSFYSKGIEIYTWIEITYQA